MELEQLLRLMVDKRASDLFITTGVAPSLKIDGAPVIARGRAVAGGGAQHGAGVDERAPSARSLLRITSATSPSARAASAASAPAPSISATRVGAVDSVCSRLFNLSDA